MTARSTLDVTRTRTMITGRSSVQRCWREVAMRQTQMGTNTMYWG